MQIELIELCDGLECAIREGEGLAFLLGYLLGDDGLLPEGTLTDLEFVSAVRRAAIQQASDAQGRAPGQGAFAGQGAPQAEAGQGGFQPVTKGSDAQGTPQGAFAGQGTPQGRAVAANARRAERVRAVVEVAGQGTEQGSLPANEVRAFELLREGYSERRLLDQLKIEGLTLNKNKLKSLRALL